MKPGPILLRSPGAFHKWSNEHRAQVWNMIERLGKGEVSYKEARELLREEKKALSAISKQVLGFKMSPGSQESPAYPETHLSKASKRQKSRNATGESTGQPNRRH